MDLINFNSYIRTKFYEESKMLHNSILKMRKWKFKKQLKKIPEIKATKVSDKVKFHIFNILSKFDIKIHVLVLNKRSFKFKNLIDKHGVNNIYMELICEFLHKISIKNPIDFKLDKFVPYVNKLFSNLKY